MDNEKLKELDIYFKKVYKCAKSLFNKIDKKLYFNLDNENLKYNGCSRGLLNLIMLESYHQRKLINFEYPFGFSYIKTNKYQYFSGYVTIALYFPYHKIGDKICIYYYKNSNLQSKIITIEITDPNKVYFINNKFKLNNPLYHWLINNGDIQYYVINLTEDNYFRKIIMDYHIYITNHANISYGYKFTYHQEASAEIIQKAWRNYRRKKNLNKWKYNIKDVNQEIEYMPDFGVKYYDTMKDFKTLI